MRIGILSLPLNTNFGGILQAYALRKFLVKEGHDVVHIEKKNKESLVYWTSSQFYRWWYGRRFVGQLLRLNETRELNHVKYNVRKRTKPIRDFVDMFVPRRVVNTFESLQNEFDCIIVGSDQIWRPHYYPEIEEAFLAFADNWQVKKIAYAPSFGVEHWEFTDKQTERCKELLKKIDVVSVREDQGKEICKRNFNRDVIRLVDPTMLLDREDYEELVGSNINTKKKQLTTYILDMNAGKREIISKLKTEFTMMAVELGSLEKEGRQDETKRSDISIEYWLKGFMHAELIFTDSFHGCVFAILFHKPFIVFGNEDRGLSRFKTLLNLFNLEDRMVFDSSQINELYKRQIDWDMIDLVVQKERAKSHNFFKEANLTGE